MTPSAPAVADDIWRLSFRLHATGHRFARGHRLRVQVSSGAHPRYARNTGTDEPLGEATRLVAADMEIFHDPDRARARWRCRSGWGDRLALAAFTCSRAAWSSGSV